jgi:translation machinery-associated protein 16
VERIAFFQAAVQENEGKALDMPAIQAKIHEFVHQYDEGYEAEKKARRPGRPASTRQDLLKVKVDALQTEYSKGFCEFCPRAWVWFCY